MRQHRALLWITLAVFAAPSAQASTQTCPWLNGATAAGVLGGSVTGKVTNSDQQSSDATCEFALEADPMARSLRIQVETMKEVTNEFPKYLARCGQDFDSLKTIGNEAVVCRVPGKDDQVIAKVIGRVRDHAFIVDVASKSSASERDALRDIARKVAEQVAGTLF
jgi:hypothetical protein